MLEPDRQVMEWLLTGHWEFPDPRLVLTGITASDACRRMTGLPYTIAGIVAHMDWWQRLRISLARGGEFPDVTLGVDDWPAVESAGWDKLVTGFLDSLDELLALVESGENLDLRQILIDDLSVGTMLISLASHNAYHLGQVVLLRRLQGTWPPAKE